MNTLALMGFMVAFHAVRDSNRDGDTSYERFWTAMCGAFVLIAIVDLFI